MKRGELQEEDRQRERSKRKIKLERYFVREKVRE